MVDYNSRIYVEDNNQIIGAEITFYSEEGNKIDSVQITSKKDFDKLVDKINELSSRFIGVDDLQNEIENLNLDAATLSGFSSTDFSRTNHTHGDSYALKNHASNETTYGISEENLFGHSKVINNLNRNAFVNGEALSAYQGKVLLDRIISEIKKLTSWSTQKCGSYGTLKINSQLRCVKFNYTRENYKVAGDKTLHSNLIPAAYRPSSVVRVPHSKYTILSINSSGDLLLDTTYSGSGTTTLKCNFFWFY